MEKDKMVLLNEKQAAAILGVSPKTLQAWRVRGGHGPVFRKIGRLCKYLETERTQNRIYPAPRGTGPGGLPLAMGVPLSLPVSEVYGFSGSSPGTMTAGP